MACNGEDLKRRLMVMFEGEDGLDYGGVSRSVMACLSIRTVKEEEQLVLMSYLFPQRVVLPSLP
jgi:hypothetical protein